MTREVVYVDIRVFIDRESETYEFPDGSVEHNHYLTPISAEYMGGTTPEDELSGLSEMLHQSDFGQIEVKDALLKALGGESGVIKRN